MDTHAHKTEMRSLDVDPAAILAVIPTLNEADHIETCLKSLLEGDPRLKDISLIVADGGSSDQTVEIVQRLAAAYPNTRTINNPGRLQSAAVNLAADAHATPGTRWLVRCDAHSIYPPNFILKVAQALKDTKAASLVVPMDAVGQTCFEKANAWIVDTPLGSGGSAHRGGTASGYVDHGHHAGFELKSFQALGGYDASFSHNEDAEYDRRVTLSGRKIYMDATNRIQYVPRGSVTTLAKQYFRYGRGRAKTVHKHKMQLKLRQAIPVLALLASGLGLALSPVFWPAGLVPAGYIAVLAAASLFTAIKFRSVCGLLAGPASGTMHMSWAMGFLCETLFARR
ncbi:MAG: glycosyltransferase family 2 protein [Pseudomonadota bacterium]